MHPGKATQVRNLLNTKDKRSERVREKESNLTFVSVADVMSVYAQIRSNQLGRSLNSLKETSQSSSLLPTSVS